MEWHYLKNSQQEGPIDGATLQGLVTSGELDASSLAWKEGMADWLPINQIAEFGGVPAAVSPPAQPAGVPPVMGSAGAPVPNYLVWSILSTLFCCLPFGIVSIVFAAKVDGLVAQGQREQAVEASNKAKQWAWYALWSGVAGVVIYLVFVAIAVGAGAASA